MKLTADPGILLQHLRQHESQYRIALKGGALDFDDMLVRLDRSISSHDKSLSEKLMRQLLKELMKTGGSELPLKLYLDLAELKKRLKSSSRKHSAWKTISTERTTILHEPPSVGRDILGSWNASTEGAADLVIPEMPSAASADAAPPTAAQPSPATQPAMVRSAPEDKSRRKFQIRLVGEGVVGQSVLADQKFEVRFVLDVVTNSALKVLSGDKLKRLIREGGQISVMLVPLGHRLQDGEPCRHDGTIHNGVLDRELVFHMQAGPARKDNAGLFVYLAVDAIPAYSFFVGVSIVEDAAEAKPLASLPDEINLDVSGIPLQARLVLKEEADALTVYWSEWGGSSGAQIIPRNLKTLTASKLEKSLEKVHAQASTASKNGVWSKLAQPFTDLPPNLSDFDKQNITAAMDAVAKAGSTLWQHLTSDPDLKEILEQLNRLPPGSRILIESNRFFIPWELLYPEQIDTVDTSVATQVKPGLFWGSRYIVQSTYLMPEAADFTAEKAEHRSSNGSIWLCVNPAIDSDEANKILKPAVSHKTWGQRVSHEIHRPVGAEGIQYVDTWQESRKILVTKRQKAAWIYVYCHGRGGSSAQLDLGSSSHPIEPEDLFETPAFEGRPIIFLNACSSGDYSPLSLINFYDRFRNPKHALGLVSTCLPVPATTAAAIGQHVMDEYFRGQQDLGAIMYSMRKQLVEKGVPIGLFYMLHCPSDVSFLTIPNPA